MGPITLMANIKFENRNATRAKSESNNCINYRFKENAKNKKWRGDNLEVYRDLLSGQGISCQKLFCEILNIRHKNSATL